MAAGQFVTRYLWRVAVRLRRNRTRPLDKLEFAERRGSVASSEAGDRVVQGPAQPPGPWRLVWRPNRCRPPVRHRRWHGDAGDALGPRAAPSASGDERRAGPRPCLQRRAWLVRCASGSWAGLGHGVPFEKMAKVRAAFAPFQLILWPRCLVPQRRCVQVSDGRASESSGLSFPLGPACFLPGSEPGALAGVQGSVETVSSAVLTCP